MAKMERTVFGAQFKGKDQRVGSDRFEYQKNGNTTTKVIVNNNKGAEIGEEPISYIPLVTPNGTKYIPVYSRKYGSSGSRGPFSNMTTPVGRACNLCYSNCNKDYSNYDDCKSMCDTTCNECNVCQGCQGCDSCHSCNGTCNSRCYDCDTCTGCNTCRGCDTCQGCIDMEHGLGRCSNCYTTACSGCNTCRGYTGCQDHSCTGSAG